jgi:hypothetical protein
MQDELDKLEAELRRIPPAAVPPNLMARLRAARLRAQPAEMPAARWSFPWAKWFIHWRGLAAVAPAATILLLWVALRPAAESAENTSGIKANAVQVGHSLVASFDAVAQLPDGEPIRFRCRKWRDDVVVHDDAHGVFITQSTPRVEVVPVRFETY